jgi:Large polyvalent protein associated domain 23
MSDYEAVDHDPFAEAQSVAGVTPWPAPKAPATNPLTWDYWGEKADSAAKALGVPDNPEREDWKPDPTKGFWQNQADRYQRSLSNLAGSFSGSGEEGLRVHPVSALPMMAYDTYKGLQNAPEDLGGEGNPTHDPAVSFRHLRESFGDNPLALTGIFAGPAAKTANLKALNQAQLLESKGVHPDQIWQHTGWGRDAAGDWEFEIPDNAAKIAGETPGKHYTTFNKFEHPELERAYGRLPVISGSYREGDPSSGYFMPPVNGESAYIHARGSNPEALKKVGIHEHQHFSSREEGYQQGANSELFSNADIASERQRLSVMPEPRGTKTDPAKMTDEQIAHKLYSELSGEVKARNAETRKDFTPEQRRAIPPWKTEGVPRNQQIVIRHGSGPPGMQASKAPGESRGAFPEGHALNDYAMELSAAEPFIFGGLHRSSRLDQVAQDLEGGITDKTPKLLNYATQDAAYMAKKLGLDEGKQYSRPAELALQDAEQARKGLYAAYETRDPAKFREAAQQFKDSLAQAARARIEVLRQTQEPAAFEHWLNNHLPEELRPVLYPGRAFAGGGAVRPSRHPHARLVGGKWQIPDPERPGTLTEAA